MENRVIHRTDRQATLLGDHGELEIIGHVSRHVIKDGIHRIDGTTVGRDEFKIVEGNLTGSQQCEHLSVPLDSSLLDYSSQLEIRLENDYWIISTVFRGTTQISLLISL